MSIKVRKYDPFRPGFVERLREIGTARGRIPRDRYETAQEAASRLGIDAVDIITGEGREFAYVYDREDQKFVLVGSRYPYVGKRERIGLSSTKPQKPKRRQQSYDFMKWLVYGPQGFFDGLLWYGLFPITVPCSFCILLCMGLKDIFTAHSGQTRYVYGGYDDGDGFFDEVSTGRRADLDFLLRQGPYA